MTVKVTLEFPSVDVAIVALAKFVGGKAARAAAEPAEVTAGAVAATPPAEKRTRRPRADKGQPREPYGARTKAEGEGAGAPAQADPATSGATAGASAAPSAQAGPSLEASKPAAAASAQGQQEPVLSAAVPSDTDAQAALEKLFNATNIQTAQDVMSRFGCKRLKELLPEQRAEFIVLCNDVANGGKA